jgi:hypothetical protein
VVLFEKGEIASGESSHAAGLVTQFDLPDAHAVPQVQHRALQQPGLV